MTGTLGFLNLVDGKLPALWDQTEILKRALRSGRTAESVLQEAQAALAVVVAGWFSDPLYSRLFYVTAEERVDYDSGSAGNAGPIELTDMDTPHPGKGDWTGHMVPLRDYGDAMGWTERGLPRLSESRIRADIRRLMRDADQHFRQKLMQRFFKKEGEVVGSTSNASQPFADGGDAGGTYIPPVGREGLVFNATHDHYVRIAALNDAAFETMVNNLAEHGHMAPFDLIIPNVAADKTAVKALGGWVQKSHDFVKYGDNVTRLVEQFNSAIPFLGLLESDNGPVFVWASDRVPTGYTGLFKSYGANSELNPLAVRYDDLWPFGWNLVPGNYVNAPLALAATFMPYGIGIGDRVAAVLTEIDTSGDYATPTIS